MMPIGRPQQPSEQTAEFSLPEKKTTPPKKVPWKLSQPRDQLGDLILGEETKQQLLNVLSYFQNKHLLFREWGLEEKYADQDGLAVNLYGPPGTGKTMAAHAIARELGLPMICVDYAEIESKYVGETSKNLSALFRTASDKNAVIFFDKAGALLSKRVTNMTSATDVSVNQTRSVLLNPLNGCQGVILFSTNFIQNVDAAFLRRIRYHIQFHLPDCAMREKLWRAYLPTRMPQQADCAALARTYDGISGSDISNAVFSAAVGAARKQESVVSQERFEQAIQAAICVKQVNTGVTVAKRMVSEKEVKKALRTMEGE